MSDNYKHNRIIKEAYLDKKGLDRILNGIPVLNTDELENNNLINSSALLVLDMQNYFLDDKNHAFVPSGKSIIYDISLMCQAYRKARLPIIFTYHTNTEDNSGSMGRWWKDLIIPGSIDSDIIPELSEHAENKYQKHTYDAFFETNIEKVLRDQGVSSVVITGVMTHLCCETTARSAFVRNFNVIMPVNTTATYNEGFHRSTIQNLSHGFAYICNSSEILNLLMGSE